MLFAATCLVGFPICPGAVYGETVYIDPCLCLTNYVKIGFGVMLNNDNM